MMMFEEPVKFIKRKERDFEEDTHRQYKRARFYLDDFGIRDEVKNCGNRKRKVVINDEEVRESGVKRRHVGDVEMENQNIKNKRKCMEDIENDEIDLLKPFKKLKLSEADIEERKKKDEEETIKIEEAKKKKINKTEELKNNNNKKDSTENNGKKLSLMEFLYGQETNNETTKTTKLSFSDGILQWLNRPKPNIFNPSTKHGPIQPPNQLMKGGGMGFFDLMKNVKNCNNIHMLSVVEIVELIKTAMKNQPMCVELQQYACGAIWKLAGNEGNRVTLVREDVIDLVCEAMKNHPNSVQIQEFGKAIMKFVECGK